MTCPECGGGKVKKKMSVIDPKLMPHLAALDGALMTGLPAPITAATGMDALTHAVEAYISTIASTLTEIQSLKAIDLIMKYLPVALEERSMSALEKLSSASTSAAMAA